jgi:integrase/recombinase XerC
MTLPVKKGLITRTTILPAEGTSFLGPLEAFLSSAVDSEHTRRAYRRHIRDAFRVMGHSNPVDVGPADLAAFREALLADGRGAATHAQALSALRSFLNWCADMGGLRMPSRTMERLLRVPKATVVRPYTTLTSGEVLRLLDASGTSLRDQALILVMLGAGLRVSEVSGLDCSDLVQVEGEPVLYVRKGKGNKDRLVPITREVEEAIHRYLAVSGRLVGAKGPLFLAEDRGAFDPNRKEGTRLTHYGIRKILRKRVLMGEIAKRITPHALRHTFGMAFQRDGKDLNLTAKVMGHASIQTTVRYADHLELTEIRIHMPRWARRGGSEG